MTAQDYYTNSVFEVVSMELKSQTAEEISFSVCVSKGGVIQEPNRTIFLQLINDAWEVVNEGYWLDSLSYLQEQNAYKNSPRYSARKFSALLSKV